jgi:hypothetical protein
LEPQSTAFFLLRGSVLPAARLSTFHGASIDRPLAAQDGYTLHLTVRGS